MKIFEITDLHLNPKWIEEQKSCLDLIAKTAREEKPSFICFSGDIWDRVFYNSDKDEFSTVLNYFELLKKYSEIIMVTGTPSHDAPGSYEIFRKMGCHVLHPAKPQIINNCLFIGLPEIDKSSFMAKHKVSMAEANQKIQAGLNNYIENYWVPVREANKNIPCVFLGHGWFVDDVEKARNNPMIKNADFIIDNNILKKIKADRYIFGHCHTPSESKVLNGGYVGYAGFDRTPWNNTGFQPGFNITEIVYKVEPDNIYVKNVKRIPYPVIRKEKIKMSLSELKRLKLNFDCGNNDVRINLKIKKSELVKLDLKEWEKKYKINYSANSVEIVPDIIKEESQRITKEQADKLNTLWKKYCFFKNWEEDSRESVMEKIQETEKNVLSQVQSKEKKDIKLLSLEVKGSIFSLDAQNKNCFSHDFSKDPTGLTLISGDNGQGKSTFLGFASPYPIFIGWDYRSLKEFFPEGGIIEKLFDVNGVIHEHQIHIPQDHNKKILCYWNIDVLTEPKNKIKQSALKDFMIECERFFGPITSFVSTSFFAQEPWRMKNYVSSLVSSSATELRNAYLEIVGISRAAEKEYAHEKVKSLKQEIHDFEIKKNTMSEILADKETVKEESVNFKKELNKLEKEIEVIIHDEHEKQKEFDKIKNEDEKQKEIINKIDFNQDAIKDLENSKIEIHEKIRRFEKTNINELKKQLKDNEDIKKQIEQLRDDWQALNKEKEKMQEDVECNQSAVRDCENKIKEAELAIKVNNNKNEGYKKINETLNIPCENCGYIKPENKKVINQNNEMVKNNEKNTELLKQEIDDYNKLKKEHEDYIKKQKLPTEQLKRIEEQAIKLKSTLLNEIKIQAIQNLITEYSQIKVYQENLEKIKSEIKTITENIKKLESKKSPFVEMQYDKISKELSELQSQLQEKQKEISGKEGMLKSIKDHLEKIKKHEKEITKILEKLDSFVLDLSEWEDLYVNFSPNKLPALELQLIAEEIDIEVNKKLAGKYIIKTNTQDINKKGEVIDRFDILVYNPKSGIEKSLLAHSPGQRAAYFTEPISQALREKRQKRENIIFLWSVADETDNPIKYERVRAYYNIMQDGLSEGHTRFIMSQKSEVTQFITNTINIEEVGKNI